MKKTKKVLIDNIELDNLIDEYLDKDIPIAIILDYYKLNSKQMNNFIDKALELTNVNVVSDDYKFFKEYTELKNNINNYDVELRRKITEESLQKKEQLLEFKKDLEEGFIKDYISIIKSIKIFFKGIPLLKEDTIELSYEGIYKAIQTYNYKLNYRFSTYAIIAMINNIKENFIEVYGMTWEEYLKYNKMDELVEDIKKERVFDTIKSNEILRRFDNEEIDLERANTFEDYLLVDEYEDDNDIISDKLLEEEFLNKDLSDNLEKALKSLTKIEKDILVLRFGLSDGRVHTYKEIAKEFHITIERVKTLEGKALRKLRHPSITNEIIDYRNNDKINKKEKVKNTYIELIKKIIELSKRGIKFDSIYTFLRMNGFEISKEEYKDILYKMKRFSNLYTRDSIDKRVDNVILADYVYKMFGYPIPIPVLKDIVDIFSFEEALETKKKM